MKSTGIVRRIDDLGRVVIPKEIRRTMKVYEGTSVEIFTSAQGIVIKKYCPEIELLEMTQNLMAAVDDIYIDLGPEKTGDIRRHIQKIQMLLKQKSKR